MWIIVNTNLLLGQVVGKVSNHDLVLGWDTIGRGTTLPALASRARALAMFAVLILVSVRLVGDVLQRLGLASSRRVGGDGSALSGSTFLLLLVLLRMLMG